MGHDPGRGGDPDKVTGGKGLIKGDLGSKTTSSWRTPAAPALMRSAKTRNGANSWTSCLLGNDNAVAGRFCAYRGGWKAARPNWGMAGAVGRGLTPPLLGCKERAFRGLTLPAAPRDGYSPSPAQGPPRPTEDCLSCRLRARIRTLRAASRITRGPVRERHKENSEARGLGLLFSGVPTSAWWGGRGVRRRPGRGGGGIPRGGG